jgi:hypothetical protein
MRENSMPPTLPTEVAPVFDQYPAAARRRLLALRRLIFETAAKTDGVGEIVETLKWGEPAYLTKNKSGTTIRLGWKPQAPLFCAVYVNCQTDLISRFREMCADDVAFEGNRAILIPLDKDLPTMPLQRCIAAALTYHRDKRRRGR